LPDQELVPIALPTWNQRDFDRAANTLELTNVFTGEVFPGPAGFRHFLQIWATAFPDGQIEVINVVEFIGRGHNSGPLRTPVGELPPTRRGGAQRFGDVYPLRAGKIVHLRSYLDVTSLLNYVGLSDLMRELI
jgi:hypothetical protein